MKLNTFILAALPASLLALPTFALASEDLPATPSAVKASALLVSAESNDRDGFASFISPVELKALQGDPNVVVVDARSAAEYAKGHIPGAINLPGDLLRTPDAKPGQGDSQYVFRTPEGQPDVALYEQLLSEAGLTRDKTVVIYGNHAGKSDGSVAAMLLDWLGQEKVVFLDGVGMTQWYEAGFEHALEPTLLANATYDAQPREDFVWNLDEVVANVGKDSTVFYDTRATDEYEGTNLRGNQRGGHIPGAVRCDYAEFLNADKTIKTREEIESILAEKGLDKQNVGEKPVVLYCQTATRVSLPYLVLRELGYENIAIYDASWHEYGNREDTPVEAGEASSQKQSASTK